jgi:DNA replication and repair protein RecF
MKSRRELDVARGTTSYGPHRDDMKIAINEISAKDFASSGQQRTAAVAIKLAEIKLMEESSGETPVVLLDDVMAELDEIRRKKVMEFTSGKCQTLITTTEIDDLDESILENASIFDVKSGKVSIVK